MKYVKQKIKEEGAQCSLCSAKFEVWLSNSRISDEKKERISQKLLSYCPVCSRGSGR